MDTNSIIIISSCGGVGLIVIISLFLVFSRLKGTNQARMQVDELNRQLLQLNADLSRSTTEYDYVRKDQERLTRELEIAEKSRLSLEEGSRNIQEENVRLSSDKSRLEVENENLKSAYLQLANLLTELKTQMNSEFSNLKAQAISELKEKADNSLREIGKENVVLPLQEYLKDLQTKIHELAVETKVINRNSEDLNQQAKNLALALTKDSKKKGDFGELILGNLLESVGLQQYVSYTPQEQLTVNDKRLIPDVIIQLPHNRAVVVDSKNIMKSYYESIVNQEDNHKALLDAVKLTIKNLSQKDYLTAVSSNIDKAVFDYAIMFIPNESLFATILEEDQRLNGELIRSAYAQKVFLAGPSTLLVLLGIIERTWDVYLVEERAEKVLQLARELNDKFHLTLQRIADLGYSIKQTAGRYDDVIKSLDNGTAASAVAKLESISLLSGDKTQLVKPTVVGELTMRYPSTADSPEVKRRINCDD